MMAPAPETIIGFVFARSGSKGVPGKNILPVGGIPLVARSIASALASSYIQTVVVSTDDEDIAEIATSAGAQVPALRPKELATDIAAEWGAWRHAIEVLAPMIPGFEGFETFVSIPPTSPLREPIDIDHVCERLAEGDVDIVVTVTPSKRNPYFNMVELIDGQAHLAIPGVGVSRRQDVPEMFDLTTIAYATTPDYVLGSEGIFDGRVGVVVVPEERALDIDTQWDLDLADLIVRSRDGLP